jgi:putative hemolysin
MALLIAVVVIGLMVSSVTGASGDRLERYFNASEEWCHERGGELGNSNVIGPHGGLHCELPNGTSVHMRDVVDIEGSEPA